MQIHIDDILSNPHSFDPIKGNRKLPVRVENALWNDNCAYLAEAILRFGKTVFEGFGHTICNFGDESMAQMKLAVTSLLGYESTITEIIGLSPNREQAKVELRTILDAAVEARANQKPIVIISSGTEIDELFYTELERLYHDTGTEMTGGSMPDAVKLRLAQALRKLQR